MIPGACSTQSFAQLIELLPRRAGQFVAEFRIVSRDVVGFLFPPWYVHCQELLPVLGGKLETGEVEPVGGGQAADGCRLRAAASLDPLANPLEHAAVFAVAGPEPSALAVFAEPVHEINLRQPGPVGPPGEGEPMSKVIPPVI